MAEVLCLGDSCADIIIPYGEAMQGRDVSASFACGGSGANSAFFLGRLGISVAFCGKAGRDLYGLAMERQLSQAGVDTSFFFLDEELVSTQILVVIDRSKDRFPFLMPREEPSYLQIHPADLKKIDLSDTKYILTNGMMLFREPAASSIASFLKQAKKKGIRILLDINLRIETRDQDPKYLKEVISFADVLLGSLEDDFLPLCGTDVRKLQKPGKILVVRNAAGSTAYAEDQTCRCESYPVEVADTLGAGDAFNAGFLYGLVKGKELSLCNSLGNAAAAYCISAPGARHAPNEEQLLSFVNEKRF